MDQPDSVPVWAEALARQLRQKPESRQTRPYAIPSRPPFRPALRARGSVAELRSSSPLADVGMLPDPQHVRVVPVPASAPASPRSPRPGRVGRALVLGGVAVLATATTYAGARIWHDARKPAPPQAAADVLVLGGDRLELAPDRRAITRTGPVGWTATLPSEVDTLHVTGPFVLGRTATSLIAVELERGKTRFAWDLPADERWGAAMPAVLGACFTILTARGDDGVVRCIDHDSGALRWTATIPGGEQCSGAVIAIPSGYSQQCSGWTALIAESGAVTVEAGGVALVRRQPPVLLRAQAGRLYAASYHKTRRRFAAPGVPLKGGVDSATSAFERNQRIVVRASSASQVIATIVPKSGAPIAITLPDLQLADDAPLVDDCGLGTAPRFQLLALAPRVGGSFDPELAQQRVLALVDTDLARVTWTSRRTVQPRRSDGADSVICRHGHYFVPLASGLWIVDASTGQTRATLTIDGGFAELTGAHVGESLLVTRTRDGWFDVRWRDRVATTGHVRNDVDAIERELGRLP